MRRCWAGRLHLGRRSPVLRRMPARIFFGKSERLPLVPRGGGDKRSLRILPQNREGSLRVKPGARPRVSPEGMHLRTLLSEHAMRDDAAPSYGR